MSVGISMADLIVKSAKAASSEVSMVGPRKFTFTEKFNKHLDIKELDIGRESESNVGINMGFTPDNKFLVIYKNENGGRKVGGSYKNPETYCADICSEVLEIIGKTLSGSGTVHFNNVLYTTFSETDIPVVLVELEKYSANAGVFNPDREVKKQ